MIKVTSLEKRYGELVAVRNLDFEIKRGETFGLLGPNGAGKSTTISMIVGLLNPDGGDIRIGNHDEINGEAGRPSNPLTRKRIGISPQSLSLYEELTANENLSFFASLYGLRSKEIKDRVNRTLEFSGLTDRRNGRVETFSGGMKRRLNIACALLHEPEILLLDEPTVGVDPQSRNHIFESIETLKESGLTVIYTTHYMEEAERLCDRVAIIDHGKLMALDTVDSLIEKHGGRSSLTGEVTDTSKFQSIESALVNNVQIKDNQVKFLSDQPFDAISELTAKHNVKFETLNVARPDLESVFLNLTGRSLRD